MKPKEYLVAWEIYLEAGSAEEAAREAIACLGPKEPGKWLYNVTDLFTGQRQNFDRLDPVRPNKQTQPIKEVRP